LGMNTWFASTILIDSGRLPETVIFGRRCDGGNIHG